MRNLICQEFAQIFSSSYDDGGVDVLLTPTAPTVAPLVEDAKRLSPVESYANDVFTVPASLAGLPAISIPGGSDAQGLPLGLQIIGPRGGEEVVLTVAQGLEDVASKQ